VFQPFQESFYILWQNSIGPIHFWSRFWGTIKLVGVKICTWRKYGIWWRNKRPDFQLASPTIEFIVQLFTLSIASSTPSPYNFLIPLQSETLFSHHVFRLFFLTWQIFSLPVVHVFYRTKIRWNFLELKLRIIHSIFRETRQNEWLHTVRFKVKCYWFHVT